MVYVSMSISNDLRLNYRTFYRHALRASWVYKIINKYV